MAAVRLLLPGLLLLAAPASTQERGALFDRVVGVLAERFHDPAFRTGELPELAARYRPWAQAAWSRDEERAVVHAMLSEVPSSHLALYSKATSRSLHRQLAGRRDPTLGLELVQRAGRFWVARLWEGGPAERAGLRTGDRIVAVDGVAPGRSPRLDWRSDDAWLPDPPTHALLVGEDDVVALEVERVDGVHLRVRVPAARWSVLDAARASVRVVARDGARIGVLHLLMVPHDGAVQVVREALRGELADCEAVVFDLRGRGGDAFALLGLFHELQRQDRPVVALIDARTRSAKEVLADRIRAHGVGILVGERTAGAVVPASFADVGEDSVLMLPQTTLGSYSERLEGVGVPPHVEVPAAGPFAAGKDPILERGLQVAADRAQVTSRAAWPRSARPARR